MRVSQKELKDLAQVCTDLTGVEHVISAAYGGYKLQKIANNSGGVEGIIDGYCSAKEVYYIIHGYIKGIQTNCIK